MGDDDVPEPATLKQYTRWKTLIPFLYDWFNNHNLTPWPSYTCRWGPQMESHTYKNKQRLYLSERTDGSAPNTLLVMNAEVIRPRVAAAEHIANSTRSTCRPS